MSGNWRKTTRLSKSHLATSLVRLAARIVCHIHACYTSYELTPTGHRREIPRRSYKQGHSYLAPIVSKHGRFWNHLINFYSYFTALGIPPDASDDLIVFAYRQQVETDPANTPLY